MKIIGISFLGSQTGNGKGGKSWENWITKERAVSGKSISYHIISVTWKAFERETRRKRGNSGCWIADIGKFILERRDYYEKEEETVI